MGGLRAYFSKLRGRGDKRDPFAVTRALIAAPAPVIFDVGANVGRTALRYRELFPDATIHCFEPFPPSFELLRATLAGDTRIHTHLLALAATRGSASLSVNRNAETNSLLASDARAARYWGPGLLDKDDEVEVATRALDELCAAEEVERVDVLKLDVQGAEHSVLEGAQEMLAAQRIDLIYMEVIMAPTYVGQHELHDHLAFLHARGYRLFDFYNATRRNGRLIQSDIIVVSAQLLERYERARGS